MVVTYWNPMINGRKYTGRWEVSLSGLYLSNSKIPRDSVDDKFSSKYEEVPSLKFPATSYTKPTKEHYLVVQESNPSNNWYSFGDNILRGGLILKSIWFCVQIKLQNLSNIYLFSI